ncbi:IgA FC receptor [Neisseria subflava]|nr:IgA FC receptor [Neisseria subflava]
MKNNAPRNSIFNCHRPLSVLLLGVVVPHAQVNADVPPPPPVQHQNAGFPSAQKLEQMGYNRETGVWKVQTNPTGKPTVSSGGGQITGKQGQRVTVTDGYGNKATVNTQVTQHVGVGKLQTAANVAVVGSTAGGAFSSAVEKYGDSIAYYWKKGDYENFINTVILASGHATDVVTGGFFSSSHEMARKFGWSDTPTEKEFQDVANIFYQEMRKSLDAGDFRGAVGNAAAAKAAEAAQKAQQQDQQKKEEKKRDEEAKEKGLYAYDLIVKKIFQPNIYKSESSITYKSYKVYSNSTNYYVFSNGFINNGGFYHNYNPSKDYSFFTGLKNPSKISLEINNLPKESSIYYEIKSYPAGSSDIPNAAKNTGQVNPSDFMLTQKEMLDILKRMLENQQTNHAELMNQLAKMGNVVPDSTTSTEFTPATATTAPYTPSGSNTPQQTQITINRDGSVTTSVIPRPDLVPNSPQAPTRSPLIPNNPSTPTMPTSPTSPTSPTTPTTPTSPNNPSTPTTPDNSTVPNKPKEDQPQQENTAYEDPDIPTQTVDLDFKPADIFSVDGVCPEPRTVDFGMFGQHEFSYDPLCDFARKIRPILILITIVSCSFFVYSSLKD